MLSPLQLAYIGDAVHELLTRTVLLDIKKDTNQLHKKSIDYVSAKAQASAVRKLEGFFSEEEKYLIKRGRNSSNSAGGNSDIRDYRYSTGFETMLGKLFLEGKTDRIIEIFKEIERSKNES